MNRIAQNQVTISKELDERYRNTSPFIVRSYQHYTVRFFNLKWALKKKLFYRKKTVKDIFKTDLLLETASKITSLTNFGNEGYLEGLNILIDSLNENSLKLMHPFGVYTTFSDIITGLCRRLLLEEAYKRYPLLVTREIKNPFYIIGLARSGTTFLHSLLAQDDEFRWIPKWESILPIPEKIGIDRAIDPRIEKIKVQDKVTLRRIPDIRMKHFVEYDKPEECNYLFMSSFRHPVCGYYTYATSYLKWLSKKTLDPSYEHYLRLLKVMDSNFTRNRWLFKFPGHLFCLREIKNILPKAKFIHIHRDPMKSLASQASLRASELGALMPKVDYAKLGLENIAFYDDMISKYMVQRLDICDEDIIDIQYHDFIKNPLGAIEVIYKHFDLNLSDYVRNKMSMYISNNSNLKHGKHIYRLKDFGFRPEKDKVLFEEYRHRFNVPEEILG